MKTAMKKIAAITLLLFAAMTIKAQEIDSVVIVPASPTTNDVITVYTYLSFPQGTCADVGTVFISGNDIYGYGFHCMGNIMSICYDVDTITFGPLAAGVYNFYSTLDAGFGPPQNCSAGFLPYDVDTLSITVSLFTGITDNDPASVRIFPNPASDRLNVVCSGGAITNVQMLNVLGDEVFATEPGAGSVDISLATLAEGVYFCRVTDSRGNVFVQQVEVMR
jgi:hypothetical protein